MPAPALKTITGTFTGPDGAGISCQVKAVLSQPCTVPGTQEVVEKAARVNSDPTTGAFSLPLYANADLTPANTYYTITAIGNVDGVAVVGTWVVVVPQSAGPFEVSNILVQTPPVASPPGALDSEVLHKALAETVTGVKHSTGGWFFDSGQIQLMRTIWLNAATGGDDSAVIQAAIDLLHTTGDLTGRVVFQSGTYFAKNLVTYTGILLEGQGSGSTILKLPNSANTHLLSTYNFDALTGTGNTGGEHEFQIASIALDGNRANNTSGRCLRIYGYSFRLDEVIIRNAAEEGLYTEWCTITGPADGMESTFTRFKIHDNGKHGWLFRGPHDSIASVGTVFLNSRSSSNTYDGIKTETTANYSAAGFVADAVHVWGLTHRIAWNLGDVAILSDTCEAEGAQTAQIRFIKDQTQIKAWVYSAGQPGDGIQVGDGVTSPGLWTIDSIIQGITANSVNVLGDAGRGKFKALIAASGSGADIAGSFAATTSVEEVFYNGATATGSSKMVLPGTLAVVGTSAFTGAASFTASAQGGGSGGFNLLLGSTGTTAVQSAELPDVVVQGGKLLIHAGFASQRFVRFDRPTVTADQAGQTITSAATVTIVGNVLTDASGGFTPTLTADYSLWVQQGSVRIDGGIGLNAGPSSTGNINAANGAFISAGFTQVITFNNAAPGLTINEGMSISDAKDVVLGTGTGTKVGTATSQKLAFHNSTPVIQRVGAAQAAVVTTASTNTTPFGYTTAAQADAIVTLVNELRAMAVEKGLMKGAA